MIKELALAIGAAITVASGPVIKRANSNSSFNIETSTVQEDLCVFYHDQYPVNTLTYLVPNKTNGDLYNDFKLLTMYAHDGDLYLYFYAESPFVFTDVKIEYSTSTTLSDDQMDVVENWQEKDNAFDCRVHDKNGERKQFYKIVADDFYVHNPGDDHRVKIKRLLAYSDNEYQSMIRKCDNSEYSWKDASSGEDQVYTYYRDNYLLVREAAYYQQFVFTKYSSVIQTCPIEAQEINWLYFSYDYTSKGVNYNLGKLKEVAISYEYLSFTNTYRVNGSDNASIYTGPYNNASGWLSNKGHGAREATFNLTNTKRMESVVTPSKRTIDTITSQTRIFFFWEIIHRINYSYNTIQDLSDSEVEKIEDKDFKNFINKTRGDYQWAIDYKEDQRVRTKTEDSWNNPIDWFNGTTKATTTCHEAKSVALTRLTFENQDGTANLNAIMNPVDVSAIVTTVPTSHTTVTFTLGSEAATRNFWIAVGIIGGILLIVGIIFLVIKIKKAKMLTGAFAPSSNKVSAPKHKENKKPYRNKNIKPKKRK